MTIKERISHVGVYAKLGKLFLKYGFNDELHRDEFASQIGVQGQIEASDDAEDFAKDLEELGPTFVKVGQLLSTRPDLMPQSWMKALSRLQDDVEAFPNEEAFAIIERELGAGVDDLFQEISDKPLAAASLGQVYVAKMRETGLEVAVKVQRPGIREKIVEEIRALEEVAGFVEKHSAFGEKYEPLRVVQQFKKSLMAELDYLREAENLVELGENLEGKSLLRVPKPISDYSTDRVLTMEYLSGTSLVDLSGVVHTELDGAGLAEELFSSYLEQVLVDGFFHADPHPGNLLLTKERKLAILDLGMTGRVPNRMRDYLLQLLVAVAEGKSSDVAEYAKRIGSEKQGFDVDQFNEAIIEVVEEEGSGAVGKMNIGGLIMKVTNACANHHLRIPNSMYLLGKMLLNLDSVGRALDPTFDPDESIRRHAAEIAHLRMRDEFKISNLFPDLVEVKNLVRDAPARFNVLLSMLAENRLKMKVDAIDEDKLLRGFQKVANRITVGLLLAAMIIGAAMLMEVESSFQLFGYPGLAILFFLGAAVGGIGMIWVIFRED